VTSLEFRDRLARRARRAKAPLTIAMLDPLEAYFRLLTLWNAKINLTALALDPPTDEAFDRLLVEPLAAAPHLTRGQTGVRRVSDPSLGGQTGDGPGTDPKPIRLFHNNTVRTIAPEYQWSASPSGTQILIGAERDGNTVSPARGVYAVDLQHKVTKAAVLARLNANLAYMDSWDGTTDWTLDASGQLTLVTKNGAAVESYAYDSNGNRTSATIFGSSAVASHDSHDRLLQQGAATFAYNGAGDLISRTIGAQTTTYQYDQIGNLKSVTPAGASVIDYIIDGNDRRVGKKVGGALVKGFLYGDFLRPVAELDAAGNVVSRFVYAYGRSPFYMIKGGVNYRIVTDHIGSVRLVIDATTGAIAQRIDYDAFGNVLQDTNPGFQPFGFAGAAGAAVGAITFAPDAGGTVAFPAGI